MDPGHAIIKAAMYNPQTGEVMPPTIPRQYTEEGFTEEHSIVLRDIDYITAKTSTFKCRMLCSWIAYNWGINIRLFQH